MYAFRQEEELNGGRCHRHHAPGKGHTRFLEYYKWPSINLEDLTSGSTLLRLLNSRGRHHPAVFAVMDLESTSVGHVLGVIPICLLDCPQAVNYSMDLGHQDGRYGTMTKFRLTPAQDAYLHERFATDGLEVLEVQDRILKFLL